MVLLFCNQKFCRKFCLSCPPVRKWLDSALCHYFSFIKPGWGSNQSSRCGPGPFWPMPSGFLSRTNLPSSEGWSVWLAQQLVEKGSDCGLEPRTSCLIRSLRPCKLLVHCYKCNPICFQNIYVFSCFVFSGIKNRSRNHGN